MHVESRTATGKPPSTSSRLASLSMLTSVMCAKAPGMAVSFLAIAYRSAERGCCRCVNSTRNLLRSGLPAFGISGFTTTAYPLRVQYACAIAPCAGCSPRVSPPPPRGVDTPRYGLDGSRRVDTAYGCHCRHPRRSRVYAMCLRKRRESGKMWGDLRECPYFSPG